MITESALFQPDIFSDPVPAFRALESSSKIAQEVVELFVQHFDASRGVPLAIWQSGGIEVNSRNFRIDTRDCRYLLKRLSLTPGEKKTTEVQQAVLGWLCDSGIPVPRPIRARESTGFCVAGKNDYWTAMSFVEGRFFEGGAASVECVGRSIGRLHRKLQAAPIAPAFRRRYVHLSDDDAQLFDEVLAAQCPMLQPFGDTNALLLAEHRDLLRRAWNTVLARQEAIHRAQCGLMHMDLHPHNILMQGDQVAAFLDFNSLKTGPLNMMLGFGAYKLLRQSVQHTDPGMSVDECQKLTDKFLDSYFKEFPEHAASRECIGHFALAEVCRRIGVIFRLTLRQANTSWNHVLKIHLAGIREICILFGLECKP